MYLSFILCAIGYNTIDNNPDEQFIIMQSTIESNKQEMKSNKQESDEKTINLTE